MTPFTPLKGAKAANPRRLSVHRIVRANTALGACPRRSPHFRVFCSAQRAAVLWFGTSRGVRSILRGVRSLEAIRGGVVGSEAKRGGDDVVER